MSSLIKVHVIFPRNAVSERSYYVSGDTWMHLDLGPETHEPFRKVHALFYICLEFSSLASLPPKYTCNYQKVHWFL